MHLAYKENYRSLISESTETRQDRPCPAKCYHPLGKQMDKVSKKGSFLSKFFGLDVSDEGNVK